MIEATKVLETLGGPNDDPSIFERLIAQEGQTLCCPGTKADAIFLIQSGSVEVIDSQPSETGEANRKILGPGQFVGELGFERNAITQFTIRALEKTQLLRIDGTGLARRLQQSCGGNALRLKKLLGLGERLIVVS